MAPRGQNRTKLIDATQRLTLAKGFPATTVDEVCLEADVSKGSFYHHFASKEDIGHAALDRYFEDLRGALTAGSYTEIADPVARMHAFVQHAGDVCSGPLLRSGCLLGSFALDLAESDPLVQAKLAEQFGGLAGYAAGLIGDAADSIDRTVDADRLGQQLLAVIEGSIVLAKAHADPELLVTGVSLFAEHLQLLFAHDTTR